LIEKFLAKIIIEAYSSEHFQHPVQALIKPVDLLGGIIKGQAGTQGPGNLEMVHYGLVTMGPGADCNSQLVKDHPSIVGMNIIKQE
jgi:hypothetical protein